MRPTIGWGVAATSDMDPDLMATNFSNRWRDDDDDDESDDDTDDESLLLIDSATDDTADDTDDATDDTDDDMDDATDENESDATPASVPAAPLVTILVSSSHFFSGNCAMVTPSSKSTNAIHWIADRRRLRKI